MANSAGTKLTLAIITRTKDRVDLLERAIKSLELQSDQNFFHIILNDGGNASELDNLLKSYPRKSRQVIHNKTSVGITRALNQAVQASTSSLIAILDDDDTWHEDRVKITRSYFQQRENCMATVVKMDVIEEELQEGELKEVRRYLHPDSGDGEISLYKQCNRNYISNGIVTYRRSVYDELNGYDETLETAEDWDFGIRLMMKYDVDLIESDMPLFFYHQRLAVTGSLGNSVHAGVRVQEITINKIRNKYLREDLREGKYGVGVIMNQLTIDTNNIVRLEGHMNFVGREIGDSIRKEGGDIIAMINQRSIWFNIRRMARNLIKSF